MPKPAAGLQTRTASGIKVQTFPTWLPITGGRSICTSLGCKAMLTGQSGIDSAISALPSAAQLPAYDGW